MGLLVLGIFNAAIGRQSIRSEFEHHAMVQTSQSQTPCCAGMQLRMTL